MSSLSSPLLDIGIMTQLKANMNTRTHTKIEVLPVFLTNQSATIRPPIVPTIDHEDIQTPYQTYKRPLIK
jgi:hypothetical protein